ncbi:sigma E protease regulator RseP [Endozoicomonas ascidiicola]|uniref:sigma E protease regulator RseP n=1 Tax=Endozoicomonas ascidiicola TaxID=1698521 RepID=UPI000ABCA6A6|nr:sigma E protease regulator RseP [Endozoicomonas ascidiicola]
MEMLLAQVGSSVQTIFAFVITLGILVSIHEFGHFWVARRCGVKVLRFSVGFGKSLWSRTDRQGTEYSIALIPLGGYVKMLDEREGPVSDEEKHLSFNSQPVLSRIAIVAAGPIANFLLAIVALWLMYLVGVRTLMPQVGEVLPESPAAVAGILPGDEIVAVDGVETPGWQSVNMELLGSLGETGSVTFAVQPGVPGEVASDSPVRDKTVQISRWLVGEEQPDPIRSLGIIPFSPEIPAVIGQVAEEGAAHRDGLLSGDTVLEANGEPVFDWMHFVEIIRANPETLVQLDVLRDGASVALDLIPGSREVEGVETGYIGAGVARVSWPETMIRHLQYGPVDALVKGAEATWSLTSMTLESIWKMIKGLVSVKNLSGPITIAKVAGASFESGLENFLYFLAMLSVSLGVLNLLPIPVLDGGHLLFYLVELVRGKPLSEQAQTFGIKVGVTLVAGVMMLAMYNDLSRLFQ